MSDMRDDLDELGRRLWPATDVLRPRQTAVAVSGHAPVRRWWQLEPLATVAAAVLLIAVIGGAVVLGRSLSSATPVPAGPTAPVVSPPVGPTASAAPTPSATAAPVVPHVVVWAVGGTASTDIRVGTGSGGFRTVASIPSSTQPFVLGAGGHHVLFSERTDGHVYDLDITTGVITDHGGGPDYWFYGAAFSPDGTRVAYVRQPGAMQPEQLRILDFGTGVITPIRSNATGAADVPEVWTAAGIAASRQWVPYHDSPGPGFVLLDPATGSRIATTDAQVNSWAIAADGLHAAHSVGVNPGQAAPATLQTETIGSAPQTLVHEDTNHLIEVMGISPDGASVLYSDDPTQGGYAGITLSPDYGLFTFSGGHRTQIAHYNGNPGTYFRGLYLNATDYLVIATNGPNSTTSTLLESSGGGPLTKVATAAGGYGYLFVVTGE